jgi:hypothetical protein
MFMIVLLLDNRLGYSWGMLWLEVIIGACTYLLFLYLLKADILKEAKKILKIK